MQFFSLFKNCIKFTPVLTRNISPYSFYFYRSYANLEDLGKAFLISRTHQSSPKTLKVQFNDSFTADFYYCWLRDSCSCEKCVHPKTHKKLLDTTSLRLDITPRFCNVTERGQLKIVWCDDDHVSLFDPKWLYRYALGFEMHLYETVHDILPQPEKWTEKKLERKNLKIEYEDVMQSSIAVKRSLENIHKYGILFIRNVPCVPGEVAKVMNRIANVKLFRWGPTFNVTTKDGVDIAANNEQTEETINFYTSMDYVEKSPGIEATHYMETSDCTDSDGSAGKLSDELYFVDGFYAAEWLRKNYPVHFNTLASVPVKFRFFTRNMEYFNYQPILKLNRSRNITEVHINNGLMAPLEGPSKSILEFYAAYKVFGKYIKESENVYRFPYLPGDMVILNNRRVLHRNHFIDPNRRLEGCFSDLDEILARYRSFLVQNV